MTTVTEGDSGEVVTAIQKRLTELGFEVTDSEGEFGAGTTEAVQKFQEEKELTADGVVGPATAKALAVDISDEEEEDDDDDSTDETDLTGGIDGDTAIAPFTVDAVLPLLPGAKRANIENNLPFVLKAMVAQGLTDRRLILAAIATIRAETGNFTPLNEFKSKYNTSPGGVPFDLYNNRKALGNGPDDGAAFKGRGFVQLTGRSNYTSIGKIIDKPLDTNPDLANDPEVAADILAVFVKRVGVRMLTALDNNDLKTARKLVNGGSFGLAEFTDSYNKGLPLLED